MTLFYFFVRGWLHVVAPRGWTCNTLNIWATTFDHKVKAQVAWWKKTCLQTIAIRTQTDWNQFKWHLQWSANNLCIYTDKLTTCCSRSQLVCATETVTRLMSLTRVFLWDSEIGDWIQLCANWFCWHSESNKNVRFQREIQKFPHK